MFNKNEPQVRKLSNNNVLVNALFRQSRVWWRVLNQVQQNLDHLNWLIRLVCVKTPLTLIVQSVQQVPSIMIHILMMVMTLTAMSCCLKISCLYRQKRIGGIQTMFITRMSIVLICRTCRSTKSMNSMHIAMQFLIICNKAMLILIKTNLVWFVGKPDTALTIALSWHSMNVYVRYIFGLGLL